MTDLGSSSRVAFADRTIVSEYLVPTQSGRIQFGDPRICLTTQRDGSIKWAVRRLGDCLDKDGYWRYEPQPSSRDDEFLAQCRFDSPEEALAALDKAQARSEAP